MKRIFVYLVVGLLLVYLIFNRYFLQIVWVNPDVNTNVFNQIGTALKSIDRGLNYAVLSTASELKGVKVLYKNAYGSGFVKYNPIPNDLDYAIGIYLGEYEYNGQNCEEIAKNIEEKMTTFQTLFYGYITQNESEQLYTNYNVLSSLQHLYSQKEANINSIKTSIPKLFNHKDYIVYTDKTIYDSDSKPHSMTFPFILKGNEILIEDYTPITIFTKQVKYNKDDRNFLREITIVTDFYVDIKHGDDTVNAEIVAESFTGQRLQLSRRFFVPVVFIGNSSASYLRHLTFLQDDEKYIEYRMFNFKRHLQELSNLKEFNERPVKLLKRVLQCTELISPVLDKNTENEIISAIEENLNNPKIKLINDYQTNLGNLIQITAMPTLYLKAQYDNQIQLHIKELLKISEEMTKYDDFKDAERIKKYTENLTTKSLYITSETTLRDFNRYTVSSSAEIFNILNSELNKTITNKSKILGSIDIFDKIMSISGFHLIHLVWLDKDLIGVVKDDFTSKLTSQDLGNMAKMNKLADVNYKLVNKSALSGTKVRYAVWVRYNSSLSENAIWSKIQSELIDDKKNFKIKRRFVPSF